MNKKKLQILLQNNTKISDSNSRKAKPNRGELPLTEKVKNAELTKKFLGTTFKIRNCF